jgi:hypothetical protein
MAKSGFWTDISTEPKRQYRWLMYIGSIPTWVIKKTNKPSYTLEQTEHQYINHTFKYPARLKWEDITVSIVDPVTPDASKTLENIMNASGYHFPTNPNDTSTISKSGAVRALGNVAIVQIGAEGEEIERWELTNAWVKSTKFGDLDYSSDEMVEIEMVLVYDFAKITKSGPGIASAEK